MSYAICVVHQTSHISSCLQMIIIHFEHFVFCYIRQEIFRTNSLCRKYNIKLWEFFPVFINANHSLCISRYNFLKKKSFWQTQYEWYLMLINKIKMKYVFAWMGWENKMNKATTSIAIQFQKDSNKKKIYSKTQIT